MFRKGHRICLTTHSVYTSLSAIKEIDKSCLPLSGMINNKKLFETRRVRSSPLSEGAAAAPRTRRTLTDNNSGKATEIKNS